MSIPKEHDYIGLSDTAAAAAAATATTTLMEKISSSPSSSSSSTISAEENITKNKSNTSLNLKETELRLGLPGSQSPERKPQPTVGVSLFGKDIDTNSNTNNGYSLSPLKNLVSGAKRGFADAIDGSSGKWVFSVSNGSEADLTKVAVLFSPRGDNGSTQKSCVFGPAKKEVAAVITQSPNSVQETSANENNNAPAAKAQVVGWPPIRSFRKNTMASNLAKNNEDAEGKSGVGCLYVKVSMDGAPYLRKVDLKTYKNYVEFSSALENMFSCFTIGQCGSGRDGLSETRLKDLLHGSEYVLTYEDKDGDWMLVGDVPWEMFTDTCKRLRIMKGSEAIGLAPRAIEKCKNRN